MDNFEYEKLSHKLLFNQMIERFCFEIEVSKINNEDIDIKKIISICNNNEVFNMDEYELIYENAKKILEKTSIIQKYKL